MPRTHTVQRGDTWDARRSGDARARGGTAGSVLRPAVDARCLDRGGDGLAEQVVEDRLLVELLRLRVVDTREHALERERLRLRLHALVGRNHRRRRAREEDLHGRRTHVSTAALGTPENPHGTSSTTTTRGKTRYRHRKAERRALVLARTVSVRLLELHERLADERGVDPHHADDLHVVLHDVFVFLWL